MLSAPAGDCPFLKPVMVDRLWMYVTPAYCRPPSGRVRVPAPTTLARLCTRRYDDCPTYRQACLGEVGPTGVARSAGRGAMREVPEKLGTGGGKSVVEDRKGVKGT